MEECDESSFRSRSNTWPLNRICESESGDFATNNASHATDNCANLSSNDSAIGLSGESIATHHITSLEPATASLLPSKKVSSRRNAWGNASYAELITQAINNSQDKRLTLSQIYDWMVQNVPYFKDKGDSNSSAGWKNSIRHNLSLHNRFMRVQNEGTGKSSWWVINPDAKPGKAARRRAASMETSKFEKKRGRVKRKLEADQSGIKFATASPSSSISEGQDTFPDSPIHSFTLSPDSVSTFRPRASSNASSCGPLTPMPSEVDAQVPHSPSNWNASDITDPQQPSAHYSGDHQQQPAHQHQHQPHQHQHQPPPPLYADHQLAEMTYHSMNIGGSSSSALDSSYLSLGSSDASDCNQVSPASSQLTLTSSNFGFGSNLSVNSGVGTLTNGTSGPPPPSLTRNDSDPFFQSSAGIDATITLSTLNGSSNNSSSTSSNLPSNGSNVNLHLTNTTMSPSLSPAQSMDTIVGHLNSSFTSSHLEPIQRKRAFTYTFAHRPMKDGSILNGQSVSQVMGQLLSINNSLPNDLDFESIQGGLECDVNSVIQHELSVEGNLDFNFDPLSAAKNHANTPVSTSMAGVHSHPWVH